MILYNWYFAEHCSQLVNDAYTRFLPSKFHGKVYISRTQWTLEVQPACEELMILVIQGKDLQNYK